MPVSLDYAASFSHATIRANDKQFSGIRSVSISQELQESAVYGTDPRPLKRSQGQIQLGTGSLTFSDYVEGADFYLNLGAEPMMALWSLDYTLSLPSGEVRSIECLGCRITQFGIEHESGADALEVTYPFSFLQIKVDGRELALAPKTVASAAIRAGADFVAGLL